jgi:two-component system OmpR family response regulator
LIETSDREDVVRVLIVEDQARLAAAIKRGLAKAGVVADTAASGEDALWMAGAGSYDALLLDVMLPGIDGFATCAKLRERGHRTPVLMLTARGAIDDRVTGLDNGADDYLVKPFALRELLARIRALQRRSPLTRAPVLRAAALKLDPAARRVWREEQEIELSAKEFLLLEALMRRPGQTLTRLELLEAGWDHTYENRSNIVDAYLLRLRAKVDRPFGLQTLETVRGVGYRLRE